MYSLILMFVSTLRDLLSQSLQLLYHKIFVLSRWDLNIFYLNCLKNYVIIILTKEKDSKNMNNLFTMHILITSLCDRDCKYCCNKQYDLSKIPYPTKEEFEKSELVCLTGGEPFKYSNPDEIAHYLKDKFNIKKIIVYTNAYEFVQYLTKGNCLNYIDGVTVSIKNQKDKKAWESLNFDY